MTHRSGLSGQILAVLATLCAKPADWQHGYAIAKGTGLKSGTLYPI
jgi:PadR family transcriptional regulator, regulatory protein PadR